MYLRVHAEARAAFEKFLRFGSEHISRLMLSVMSLLGPLRRCCSGGALRTRVRLPADSWHEQVVPDPLALSQFG